MYDRRQISRAIVGKIVLGLQNPLAPREINWLKASDFVKSVGLNTHFGQPHTPYASAFDAALPFLEDLGIRNLREDLGSTARCCAYAQQFQRIRKAASKGFRFSLICFDGFNHPVHTPIETLETLLDWSDGAVDYFEGPNEPAIGRSSEAARKLLEYQSELYNKVHSSRSLSGIRVIGPSLISENILSSPDMSRISDFGNIHPYPGYLHPENSSPAESLSNYSKRSKFAFNELNFVASEAGYHSALSTNSPHLPVPEEIKARYIPRMLLWYFLEGVQATYIYEGISSFSRGSTDPESNFGLLRGDLSPTGSYHAVRNLMLCFRSAQNNKEVGRPYLSVQLNGGSANLHHAGFQKSDGTKLVAFWRGTEGWNAHSRTLLPQANEIVRIGVSGVPCTIRLHRFGDDGLVSSTRIVPSGGQFELSVNDQLTLVAFS